jgi:hypothetical protein
MKKNIIFTLFGLAFVAFLFTSSSGGRASAAGSANTGAPGETTTCSGCHSGGSYNPSISIQIFQQGTTTAVTQYTAGTTYDMKVTLSASGSPGGYGFQMVALKNTGNTNAGTWSSPGANTKIASVGTRSYVEHGVNSTFSATNNFTMKWTAPAAGTGAVTFYSAGNVVNGTGNTSGDSPVAGTLSITESIPNVSAGTASNISITDIGNNGNGTDLQVAFSAPANQNTVGQYRVMVVKQANVASFNLTAANAVTAGSYSVITPNGSSTYTQALSALSRDVNGAFITNGQPYTVFILSVADGTNANTNALSSGSNSLTLQGVAGMATNVTATDVGNTGADLSVMFMKPAVETTVGEYRIIAVPLAGVAMFNLTLAQMVTSGNYISVTPNNSASYTRVFGAGATDAIGSPIANGQSYKIFVLSMADGTNAITNTLSAGSNTITLQTVASVATNVTALDTANTGTSEDLLVHFTAASDETTVGSYKLLIVPSANAGSFDLAAANAVSASNSINITPSGSATYITTFAAGSTDVTGAAITHSVAYKAFVLSVADGTIAATSTLSTASNELTLNDPTSTYFQKDLVANVAMVGEQLNVRINDKFLNDALRLELFDAAGRLVLTKNLNDTETWLPMSSYSSGIYRIRISNNAAFWSGSILKM